MVIMVNYRLTASPVLVLYFNYRYFQLKQSFSESVLAVSSLTVVCLNYCELSTV